VESLRLSDLLLKLERLQDASVTDVMELTKSRLLVRLIAGMNGSVGSLAYLWRGASRPCK
jgi:hypothetical protein